MCSKFQPPFEKQTLSPALKQACTVYKGARFEVLETCKKAAIIHPGAVVIVPIVDNSHFLLIKNERFVVGEILWELPAGTLEQNEHPEETAYRELIEETGFKAKRMQFLNQYYTTPGFCNEKMFAYAAQDLEFVGQNLDENEKIEVEVLSFEKAKQMIFDGTIKDAKTIATLLYYLCLKNKVT